MRWKLCFVLNKRRVCIWIPVFIPKWRPPQDWNAGDPEPFPVITGDLLKPQVVKDLQVLATMDALASSLSPALRTKLSGEIRGAAEPQLGPGVELHYGK